MPLRNRCFSALHSTIDANVFFSSKMDSYPCTGDHADRSDAQLGRLAMVAAQ